jgi:MFS family permease
MIKVKRIAGENGRRIMNPQKKNSAYRSVVTVVIIFGIISLFGDVVYEGARSANSQYLNLLGISATTVGLVFGIGEFLGYALRLLAGVLSDKTHRQWVFIFIGYGLLIVVSLMGLTVKWPALVILILLERIGKALRSPAKDTILSSIAQQMVGVGTAFGVQEALDQVGAFLGPMIFTTVFALSGTQGVAEYQLGYRLLIIPFIALMGFLYYAYRKIEREELIPEMKIKEFRNEKLSKIFWVYTLFTLVGTLGFVNFSTIGYHLKARDLMDDATITGLYGVAMIMDAVMALVIGKLYDTMKARSKRKTGGLAVLVVTPIFTILLPFFTLTENKTLIIIGMMLFGIIMGTHETIMRSAISDITPFYKRGTGYGVYNAAYGLALFGGASLFGYLYDQHMIPLIQGITVVAEIVAVILFVRMLAMTRENPEQIA